MKKIFDTLPEDMDKKLKIKHIIMFVIIIILIVTTGIGIYFMNYYVNNEKRNNKESIFKDEEIINLSKTYLNYNEYMLHDSSLFLKQFYNDLNPSCEIEYCNTDITYDDLETKLLDYYSKSYADDNILSHFKKINNNISYLNRSTTYYTFDNISVSYLGSKLTNEEYYYKVCYDEHSETLKSGTECKIISFIKQNDKIVVNNTI
mgnify:CR=1 FL=1|jgi:hypothetical protein